MKTVVWDLPTRIFHWSLATAVVIALLASRREWLLELHATAGYAIFGLIIFRIIWGFAGNRYARFSGFLTSPGEVAAFIDKLIRMKPPEYAGHNPVIGWVAIMMIALLLISTLTGLVTYGGEEFRGVMAGLFGFAWALKAHTLHRALAYILATLITLHLLAAAFHVLILKNNIVLSMITGTKIIRDKSNTPPCGKDYPTARGIAIIILLLTGVFSAYYFTLEGTRDYSIIHPSSPYPAEGAERYGLEPNPLWLAECATACHEGFHPALLTEVSWRRVAASFDDHFGEELNLDKAERQEILAFLIASSAEKRKSEVSMQALLSTNKNNAPIRVTETLFWQKVHSKLDKKLFLRDNIRTVANCKACHMDADGGLFEDMNIFIPPLGGGGVESNF